MRGICKLFLTINNKSPEPSNEIIRIIFYAKVCNIMSDAIMSYIFPSVYGKAQQINETAFLCVSGK
jgi:hypothetical protein